MTAAPHPSREPASLRSAPPLAPRRAPGVRDFALVAACEAGVRGMLISVMPLSMIRAWGDGSTVSALYFAVGVLSLLAGLAVPAVSRIVPRSRLIPASAGLYVAGVALALTGNPWLLALALLVNAVATASFSVVLSAYVLDHIPRGDLGRNESTRMLYSAVAWASGPVVGVVLLDLWRPAPFLLAGACALAMAAAVRRLGLGDGRPAPEGRSAFAYLGIFLLHRPRLVAGWAFAVIRSCGWWVYVVYLPLFCIEQSLGDQVGGACLSATNALLFATPLLLRLVDRLGVRAAVRGTFAWCAMLFLLAGLLSPWPWVSVAALLLGSAGLIMLDVCGSLPFLMAVKPSERTEMAAVYASFRDVSGIVTPAVAGIVLLGAPVAAVFAALAGGMGVAVGLAGTLHPRLGARR